MYRLLSVVLFGYFFLVIQAATSAQATEITLDAEPFTKKFVSNRPNGNKLIEFVRNTETFEDWTKLVSFRFEQMPNINNEPSKIAYGMAMLLKSQGNPSVITENKKLSEAMIDFIINAKNGFHEFNVFRYAKSHDGKAVVSLHFVYRFKDSSTNNIEPILKLRASWIKQAADFNMNVVHAAFSHTMQDVNAALDRREYTAALTMLEPLVQNGDVDALGTMGNIYAFGWGVASNFKIAYDYWIKAAEKHLATAMYNIGTLYLEGKLGFAQDDKQAAIWMKQGAEHGHISSMLNVSSMYATGRGLGRDLESAIVWASLAQLYTKDPQDQILIVEQLKKLRALAPKEQSAAVQNQIDRLKKVIDANILTYKLQNTPPAISDAIEI